MVPYWIGAAAMAIFHCFYWKVVFEMFMAWLLGSQSYWISSVLLAIPLPSIKQ